MKTFIVNDKKIYFGSNAKENTLLLKKFKEINPEGLWFHLSEISSSHGFYLGSNLSKIDLRIIGNILLKLSKESGSKVNMDICKIADIIPTKTNGLVIIERSKKFRIKIINGFKLEDYK